MIYSGRRLRAGGLLLLALYLLGTSVSVAAVEYRGIGGQPAKPRADNPRSSSIFVYELKPGQIVRDAIKISNGTSSKERISVYATDSLSSSGGAFACEQKADEANDVGSWIKLDQEVVELQPQSSVDVGFTLTVPQDATVGENNGCIAIQALGQRPERDINGITLNFRSAVRVAVTIPGAITKALTITQLKTQKAATDDTFSAQVVLKNSGNVSLDTDLTIRFKDIFGRTLQTVTGTYAVIAGMPTELNFDFKKVYIPGVYRLEATAAYNDDVTKSLGQSTERNKIADRSHMFFAWPKTQYVITLALVLLIVGALAYRFIYQRRMLQLRRANARQYTTESGDTLEKIAERFDSNWYDIALLNGLKPPYKVRKSQVLYIPQKAQPKSAKKTKGRRTKRKNTT